MKLGVVTRDEIMQYLIKNLMHAQQHMNPRFYHGTAKINEFCYCLITISIYNQVVMNQVVMTNNKDFSLVLS
jgi:hypothetical protein